MSIRQQREIDDLKARVAALEAALAKKVKPAKKEAA